MRITLLVAAGAASALLAGAAVAQPVNPADPVDPAAPADTVTYDQAVSGGASTAPMNDSAPVTLPASSSALGDSTTMTAADPGVVSNGPVADTPENRARYGGPMSRGGRMTAARGN